jgi:hypothetical protein
MRIPLVAIGIVVAIGVAGCGADRPPPRSETGGGAAAEAPAPVAAASVAPASRGDALVEARQCGRALGIAVRCNLVRDDRDFAVLRYAVLQGLENRYGSAASNAELAELVDLATLDRITSIGACTIPAADAARVEAGVRSSIDRCSQP